jgi:acid phosphatase family membrane protein YuiD
MSLVNNFVLVAALTAWGLAQVLKVPIEYLRSKQLDWTLLLHAGGMPSSHSSLLVATTHAIGLSVGFDSPLFAMAVAISMVVVYDATGIRRQAGIHAALINAMIRDLASGHPLKQEQLREILGHTPLEVLGGVILGITIAQIAWFIWPK